MTGSIMSDQPLTVAFAEILFWGGQSLLIAAVLLVACGIALVAAAIPWLVMGYQWSVSTGRYKPEKRIDPVFVGLCGLVCVFEVLAVIDWIRFAAPGMASHAM